jgi:hypothetical protein
MPPRTTRWGLMDEALVWMLHERRSAVYARTFGEVA